IEDHIQPKNKKETDKHILHVYDKPWRSHHVQTLLHLADKSGKNISHIKVLRHR
ncbi:12456_t:CDS:2, partial [Funneliformis caledonium]